MVQSTLAKPLMVIDMCWIVTSLESSNRISPEISRMSLLENVLVGWGEKKFTAKFLNVSPNMFRPTSRFKESARFVSVSSRIQMLEVPEFLSVAFQRAQLQLQDLA